MEYYIVIIFKTTKQYLSELLNFLRGNQVNNIGFGCIQLQV